MPSAFASVKFVFRHGVLWDGTKFFGGNLGLTSQVQGNIASPPFREVRLHFKRRLDMFVWNVRLKQLFEVVP